MKRKTSINGIKVIKTFEGLRLKAYLCPAGIPTIGYGHTGNVKLGEVITPEAAEKLLQTDLIRFENAVTNAVKVPLTQGQFDALVSFTYNVGVGNLQKSTLLKRINASAFADVPTQFRKWIYGNPKQPPLLGLIRRREAEINLWQGKQS